VPGAEEVIDRQLNMWRGFGVEAKPGAWPLMQAHIKTIIAAGDPDSLKYIINWLAWAVQNPGTRAEVALVLHGGKGTGYFSVVTLSPGKSPTAGAYELAGARACVNRRIVEHFEHDAPRCFFCKKKNGASRRLRQQDSTRPVAPLRGRGCISVESVFGRVFAFRRQCRPASEIAGIWKTRRDQIF
jgi:hypothetical protein